MDFQKEPTKFFLALIKSNSWAGKMVQPVKAPAAKPDNLRLIQRSRMIELTPSCPLMHTPTQIMRMPIYAHKTDQQIKPLIPTFLLIEGAKSAG